MYIKKSLVADGIEINIGDEMFIEFKDGNEEIKGRCELAGFETMCGKPHIEIRTDDWGGLILFADVIEVRKAGK